MTAGRCYGMGDKVDPGNAGTEKGYHVTMGAGMNHWVHHRPGRGPGLGKGPFEITYVNPADDPRTK